MSHTPTPWICVPQSNGATMIAREYETGNQMNPKGLRIVGFTMARGSSLKEDEANAAFIVRAVNSHADLLAALEAAVYFLEENKGRIGYASGSPMHKKIKEMQSVISKAKGESK